MSKIEWANKTWNPVTGCDRVSPGCANCYAEKMARRLAGRFGYPEAPNHFDVTWHPDKLFQPFQWVKPRTVFVCSMGDLFHEDVCLDVIKDMFAVMHNAPQHTFIILTKRPYRMMRLLTDHQGLLDDGYEWPLANVWGGVSIENQAAAVERIPLLADTPLAKRIVNLEPLLEEVDLCRPHDQGVGELLIDYLDGVFLGGESGPGAQPMAPKWVRKIRRQCNGAGKPFFFKQWGEYLHESQFSSPYEKYLYENAVLYGFPGHDGGYVRVGKQQAGRILDGREWNELPNAV